MESGLWVQERVDDTLILTNISAPPGSAHAPWMRSVPAPWMLHSISTRWIHPDPRPHNTRIHSTAADINQRAPEQQRAGNRLSKERISNFLINSLGRLTATEADIICAICQEEINLKERVAILRCNHSYHAGCIGNWLMIKNECAVCRARAIPDENV